MTRGLQALSPRAHRQNLLVFNALGYTYITGTYLKLASSLTSYNPHQKGIPPLSGSLGPLCSIGR